MERHNNIFVRNVPPQWAKAELDEVFGKFGTILSSKVLFNNITAASRGIAFVRYSKYNEATNAISQLSGYCPPSHSKPLVVKFAKDNGIPGSNQRGTTDSNAKDDDLNKTNLYVVDLPLEFTKEDFHNFMKQYGTLISSTVLFDAATGLSRGIGFARFVSRTAAIKALQGTDGVIPPRGLKPISVRFARDSFNSSPSTPAHAKSPPNPNVLSPHLLLLHPHLLQPGALQQQKSHNSTTPSSRPNTAGSANTNSTSINSSTSNSPNSMNSNNSSPVSDQKEISPLSSSGPSPASSSPGQSPEPSLSDGLAALSLSPLLASSTNNKPSTSVSPTNGRTASIGDNSVRRSTVIQPPLANLLNSSPSSPHNAPVSISTPASVASSVSPQSLPASSYSTSSLHYGSLPYNKQPQQLFPNSMPQPYPLAMPPPTPPPPPPSLHQHQRFDSNFHQHQPQPQLQLQSQPHQQVQSHFAYAMPGALPAVPSHTISSAYPAYPSTSDSQGVAGRADIIQPAPNNRTPFFNSSNSYPFSFDQHPSLFAYQPQPQPQPRFDATAYSAFHSYTPFSMSNPAPAAFSGFAPVPASR